MSEPRRYGFVPKRGELMSTSTAHDCVSAAAREAFDLLNAGARVHWRGYGDTKTAARDRAAEEAGLSLAQAERLWKNWKTMTYPNGDVYRLLRNKYGHLCKWIENAADALERERREIEENNAVDQSPSPAGEGMAGAAQDAAEQETT